MICALLATRYSSYSERITVATVLRIDSKRVGEASSSVGGYCETQVRNNSDCNPGTCSVDHDKWLNSGYILKVVVLWVTDDLICGMWQTEE